MATSARQARNLPPTRAGRPTGAVTSGSRVPARCSSDQARMVIAADRKMRVSGSHSNMGRTSAMLRLNQVSTQKTMNRVATRKAPKKRKAAGVAKKPASSRRATVPSAFIAPSRRAG